MSLDSSDGSSALNTTVRIISKKDKKPNLIVALQLIKNNIMWGVWAELLYFGPACLIICKAGACLVSLATLFESSLLTQHYQNSFQLLVFYCQITHIHMTHKECLCMNVTWQLNDHPSFHSFHMHFICLIFYCMIRMNSISVALWASRVAQPEVDGSKTILC